MLSFEGGLLPQVRSDALRLSVIVPFHKNLAQLRQCLAALQAAGDALPDGVEIADFIVAADGALDDPAEAAREVGATVLAIEGPRGPAVARNRGAAIATGDVLVFVDTDVVVTNPSLAQFSALFTADPHLAAAFGAYDDAPASETFLSQCRNLGHSFVHHRANRDAETFWAGLGAVRANVFASVRGFDERFTRPSVEDIDLGYRVRASGGRIVVDPAIQGKHLKCWTFRSSIISDVRDRGIPWTQLIQRYGVLHNDLNLTRAHRASVVVAYLLVFMLIGAWWKPWLLLGVAGAVAGLWLLDRPFYRYFTRHRGVGFTLRWFPFHIVHHLCNGLSFGVGTTLSFVRRRIGVPLPGALPITPWSVPDDS